MKRAGRVTYVMRDGKLVEKNTNPPPNHSDTYQVGDLPDIQKDIAARKIDIQKKNNAARKAAIIQAVGANSGNEANTYNEYVNRETQRNE